MGIVEEMHLEKGLEGIVLGGTELPLILQQGDFKYHEVFDTTKIHVNAIVEKSKP